MSILSANQNRYLWASAPSDDYGADAVEDDVLDADADRVWQDVRSMEINTTGETVHVPRQRGSVSGNKHGFIKGACEVSGELPLLPYISADDQIPHNDAMLKAMGLTPDLDTTDEATYTISTAAQPDATVYKYQRQLEDDDWRLMVARGLRCDGSFTFETNSEPMVSVADGLASYYSLSDPAAFIDNTTGEASLLKDGSTDVASLAEGSEFFADQDPLMCVDLGFTLGSTSHVISACEINLNWTVDRIDAVTGAETFIKALLTRDDSDSRIGGSFTLADYTATILNDLIDQMEDGSEAALELIASNGTDQVTMTLGQVQIGVLESSTNGNLSTYDIPFFANGDWSDLGADNDLELLFDAAP